MWATQEPGQGQALCSCSPQRGLPADGWYVSVASESTGREAATGPVVGLENSKRELQMEETVESMGWAGWGEGR